MDIKRNYKKLNEKVVLKNSRSISENILYWIMFLVMSLLVFGVSVRHIDITKNLMAWDELGYWSNAAYIAGYDWSSAASAFCGYYSYGYSILIALLLMIFKNGGRTYQAAIVLNGLFMAGNFALLNQIGKRIFSAEKKWYVLGSALVVSFYTNNLCQSCWAWTESEIIFLYTLLVFLFISIEMKYNLYKLISICLLSIYLYIVHPRTIGIVIASFLIFALACCLKRVPVRDLCVFLIICGIIGGACLYWKDIIKHGVYVEKPSGEMANTISNVIPGVMTKFYSLYGIVDLLKTFANRFLYWGITTFGIFYIMLFSYIKHIIRVIKKESLPRLDYAFIALSVLGVFGVMTLHLSQAGYYQALLYGRYQDIVVCPVFLIGIMLGITRMDSGIAKIVFMTFPIMVILLVVAKSIPMYLDYFVINCNTNMYKYWVGTKQGGYDFNKAIMISENILLLIWFIANIHKKTIQKMLLTALTVIMCVSFYQDSEKVFDATFSNYMDMQGAFSEIHKICESEEEIYFYKDTAMPSMLQPLVMWLQLEMFDKRITVIESTDDAPPNSYLVCPREMQGDEYITSVIVSGLIVLEDKFVVLYLID